MKKAKLTAGAAATFLIAGTTAFQAFASTGVIPTGTVVLGGKAYSLDYANNPSNTAEIQAAIVASNNQIFVKGFDGNWVDNNSGAKVDASAIPAVTYTADGKTTVNYPAADGTAVTTFTVSSVNAVSYNRVDVVLKDAVTAAPASSSFSIKDASGNALAVTGVKLSSDGKTVSLFTSAQTGNVLYTLTTNGTDYKFVGLDKDTTSPTVSSAVATSNTQVSIAFSKAVDESALNISNYSINGLQVLKAEYGVDPSGNVDKTTVVLTTSAQTQGTIYKVAVTNVNDLAGNAIDTNNNTFQFGGLAPDTTKPQLSAAVAETNTSVGVVFNEKVDKASAENIANYSINGLSVLKAELQSDGVTVKLTTTSQTQGTIYKVVVTNVNDLAGNVLDTNYNSFQFGGLAVDTTKPQVASAVATSNATVSVAFNKDIDKTSAENIANYSINGLAVLKAELQSDNRTVKLTTAPQTQGTIYKVVVSGVQDISGNVVDSSYNSFQFGGLAVDTTKPTVVSAVSTGNTSVKVTFSKPLDSGSVEPYDFYFGSELGYATKVVKDTTVTDGTVWDVTTKAQESKLYTVDVTGVADASGNILDENNDTAQFGGIASVDTVAPKVTSAVALNNNTLQVTFDKALDSSTVLPGNFSVAVQSGTEELPGLGTTPTVATLSNDNKTVTLGFKSTTMTQGVLYKITALSGLKSESEIPVGSTNNVAVFAGISVANTAPSVSSAILLNNQTLKISFNEPVKELAPLTSSDIIINSLSGAPTFTGSFVNATLAADGKSVTVYYNGTGSFAAGSLYTVSLKTAKIQDSLGMANLADGKTTGQTDPTTFAGISASVTAPTISSIIAVDTDTVDVTFDQAVTVSNLITNALASGEVKVTDSTGATVTAAVDHIRLEGTDGNKVRIFFKGAPFTAGKVYTVALNAADVVNANGTAMSATKNSGVFAAISQTTTPKLSGVTLKSDQGVVFGTVDDTNNTITFSIANTLTDNFTSGTATLSEDVDLTANFNHHTDITSPILVKANDDLANDVLTVLSDTPSTGVSKDTLVSESGSTLKLTDAAGNSKTYTLVFTIAK